MHQQKQKPAKNESKMLHKPMWCLKIVLFHPRWGLESKEWSGGGDS